MAMLISMMAKFKMYVRWKVLFGLGTIFWLLLCLMDTIPVHQSEHMQIHVGDVQIAHVEPKRIPKIKEPPPIVSSDEEGYNLLSVIFWNLIAFVSTLCCCFVLKIVSNRMNVMIKPSRTMELGVRRISSSKIPIPVVSKSSSIDIHIDSSEVTENTPESEGNKSCPNLFTKDADSDSMKPDKSKKPFSVRLMEKHCAKLREDMINHQTNSLKEHASVTKRLDVLIKEKKELNKQMCFLAKENKSLKQQVDDMLDERTLMIKRLEGATKEIRANTKSKKTTLLKLDEAIANTECLKMNLEKTTKDKTILEDKLMMMDMEYKRIKEELAIYKHRERIEAVKLEQKEDSESATKEHAIDVFDIFDDGKTPKDSDDEKERILPRLMNELMETDEFDIRKSEQDMKKVQQKLLTLERSLENFKFRDTRSVDQSPDRSDPLWPVIEKSDSPFSSSASQSIALGPDQLHMVSASVSIQSLYSEDTSQTDQKECMIPGCILRECDDLETSSEFSLDTIAHDLQQHSIQSICTEPNCTLEHSECTNPQCFLKHKLDYNTTTSSDTSLFNVIAREQIRILSLQKPVKYLRTTVSDDRLSAISEKVTTTADNSEDEFEPTRKIFTNTPEFQKLLKEILDGNHGAEYSEYA